MLVADSWAAARATSSRLNQVQRARRGKPANLFNLTIPGIHFKFASDTPYAFSSPSSAASFWRSYLRSRAEKFAFALAYALPSDRVALMSAPLPGLVSFVFLPIKLVFSRESAA